jgi:hypothetical protein
MLIFMQRTSRETNMCKHFSRQTQQRDCGDDGNNKREGEGQHAEGMVAQEESAGGGVFVLLP